MTTEEILEAVRALPEAEQLEILQSLATSLGGSLSPLAGASARFWAHPSIEE
jgi:hypothetical protein